MSSSKVMTWRSAATRSLDPQICRGYSRIIWLSTNGLI
jgi:hypothetical protein